jgi:hypothetical protein
MFAFHTPIPWMNRGASILINPSFRVDSDQINEEGFPKSYTLLKLLTALLKKRKKAG